MTSESSPPRIDVALIGSGIMSANLGVLLRNLSPGLKIETYEMTEGLSQQSSHGWNNAGTGHAGICELSYTPNREKDGSVDVARAIKMFEDFERTKQFWSFAVAHGIADQPREFITQVAHLSFVYGAEQVDFLQARYDAMSRHPFFSEMKFSTDPKVIAGWAPLLVEGRQSEPIAATWMSMGTDVNFGAIARKLLGWLGRQSGCQVLDRHRVVGVDRAADGWDLRVKDLVSGATKVTRAKFVFVGAGGGSLPILQMANLPEAKGLGGFPVGGHWLVCTNPAVVQRHHAKVYGQALPSAPTMAVPHLDSRVLDGQKALLFGPFAAWTTRFLHKESSWTDLFTSVRPDNFATLIKIGVHNVPLVRYLVQQGTQSMADRIALLRTFYPEAKESDWSLKEGGIRVQAIKQTDGEAGIVHYGTEVITSADRSICALLGASPGASVSVSIALDVIKQCFPELMASPEGRQRMLAMVPTFDQSMVAPDKAGLLLGLTAKNNQILQLA